MSAAPATARLPRIRPPRVKRADDAPRRSLGSLPFVLLVSGLLAGGLLALLIVNNTLAAGSFEQARLKADLTLLGEQEQALNQEVERLSSPTMLRASAKVLGMTPAVTTTYVDLTTGEIFGTPIESGPAVAPTTAPAPAAHATARAAGTDGVAAAPPSADSATTAGANGGQDAGDGAGAGAGAGADAGPGIPAPQPGSGPQAGTAYDRAVVSGGGQ